MSFSGRPVSNVNDMAFDFDGDDYLDPVEEEELMSSLDEDDDEFDEDDFDEDIDDDDF